MSDSASILIADDEELFREATGRALRQKGYQCHCAEDAQRAIDELRDSRFDVLIADIRMPHNQDLYLVRKAQELDQEMAVIVATGYPSTETAIQSVELPVAVYLTKPLDIEELVGHIQAAVSLSRRRRTVVAVTERLQTCLADLEAANCQPQRLNAKAESIPDRTIRTLAACLSELLELSAGKTDKEKAHSLCQLLDCPNQGVHRQAIMKAIKVLRETRDQFKSKALATLREELESAVGL